MQISGAIVRKYEHWKTDSMLADYVAAALYADGGEDEQNLIETYLVTIEAVGDDEYEYVIYVWYFDEGLPDGEWECNVDFPGAYADYGIVERDYVDEDIDVDDWDQACDYLCDVLERYLGC